MVSNFLNQLTLKGKVIFFSSILLFAFTLMIVSTMTIKLNTFFHSLMADTRSDIMTQKKVYLQDLVMTGVQIAQMHLKNSPTEESKEKAREQISKLRFQNGIGYFFAYEEKSEKLGAKKGEYIYALHGFKNELVGTDVDLNQEYRREIIAKAHEGGGFVVYEFEKPITMDLKKKLSYAYEIPEWGWIIGAGIYIDDIEKEIADQIEKEKNYRFQLVLSFILVSFIFFGFIILAGHFFIGQSVENILKSFFIESKKLSLAAQEGSLSVRAQEEHIHFEFRGVIVGFNGVIDSFLKPVSESIKVLSKVSHHDLTVRMEGEFKGDYLKLQEALNETIESMNQILYQAQLLIIQLSLNASSLAKSSQQLCEGHLGQGSAIISLTENIKKLSSKLEILNSYQNQNQNQNSDQIRAIVQDQILFIEEILKAVETIEKNGKKGLLSAEQYSGTAEILADQAFELSKVIGTFKLDQ